MVLVKTLRGMASQIAQPIALAIGIDTPTACSCWRGETSTLWSEPTNWDNEIVPGMLEVALFDPIFNNPCDIDVDITNLGVQILAGHTAAITQGAASDITLGARGWNQSDGVFIGSSFPIVTSGDITINGGSYLATSGSITFTSGNLVNPFDIFQDNGGSVVFTGNGQRITGITTFSILVIDNGNPLAFFAIDDNITVEVLLDSQSCQWSLGGNTIFLEGDYIGTNSAASTPSDGVLEVSGTGAQEIFSNKVGGACNLPGGFVVNKPSGTLTLYDEISYYATSSTQGLKWIQGNIVYVAGVVIQAAGFSHSVDWPKGLAPTMPHLRFSFANSATTLRLLSDFEVGKKDDDGTGGGQLRINVFEFNCLGDFDHNRAFLCAVGDVLNVGGAFNWVNSSMNNISGQWFLNCVGPATADNCSFQDLNALGSTANLQATNSVDGGNNDGIDFI